MRQGIEKKLYDKFNELITKHEKPAYAVAHLDYMVFVEYKHEFERLSHDEQMEVRIYMKAIELLHGKE
jgi:hypothetical protein